MQDTDTKQRITHELRNTDEPAMSAAMLAEQLDVSVRTINTHITDLVENGQIQSLEIGNATAYYTSATDRPVHKKPDHHCDRCGREIWERFDFAKMDETTYFEGKAREPSVPDFWILCRFCHSDLVNWMFRDSNAMGDYPSVDHWNVPEEQVEAVKSDPEIDTESPTVTNS